MTGVIISYAALAICASSLWAAISSKVKDGVIGKIILFFICISSFAVFARPPEHFGIFGVSEATLIISIAAYMIRKIWIKTVWHRCVDKYYKCNPHRDRRRKHDIDSY